MVGKPRHNWAQEHLDLVQKHAILRLKTIPAPCLPELFGYAILFESNGGRAAGMVCAMPTISVFFGICVRMYYGEHGPPHFHVYYGEDDAAIAIESLEVIAGRLPRRAMALALEWAAEHRAELRDNWNLAEAHSPLKSIEPLD